MHSRPRLGRLFPGCGLSPQIYALPAAAPTVCARSSLWTDARTQQALVEAAGWKAAHVQAELHNVALQDAERVNREAQASTLLGHAAEMGRIAMSEQHRARLQKGRELTAGRQPRLEARRALEEYHGSAH